MTAESGTVEAAGPIEAAVLDRAPFEPSNIRAVAFDAYGTLFSWDFQSAIKDVLDQQGLGGNHEEIAKTFQQEAFRKVSIWAAGHAAEDGKLDRKKMLEEHPTEWMTTWEMWRRQFVYTFEKYELRGDAEAGASHLRTVLSHAPAYPDAFETIERLARHGLLLGLMSNADEDFLQSALSFSRLRFSVIQSSESLRMYKPTRTTFLALCHRLGYAPGEVLYVGDSAAVDVGGALHAGMRAAWVNRPEEQTPQPPPAEGEPPREELPTPDIEVASLLAIAETLGA